MKGGNTGSTWSRERGGDRGRAELEAMECRL